MAVYGPIKKYFEIEVNAFQKAHPGRIINQSDVARLFTSAYLKGATPANAISGFRASGIYPSNRHAIAEEHFAPSEVYQLSESPATAPKELPTDPVLAPEEPAADLEHNVVQISAQKETPDQSSLRKCPKC